MSVSAREIDPAILTERDNTLSPDELALLLDEDESKLEEREAALAAITQYVAEQAVKAELEHQTLQRLHERYSLIEQNVKSLRRQRERINCRLSDGSRIYDLEVAI